GSYNKAAGILLQYTFWQFLTPISSSFVRNPGIDSSCIDEGEKRCCPRQHLFSPLKMIIILEKTCFLFFLE
ncbi:hypothetical protein, partial [Nostoc sp.]|uniref:hypothetical protein n=1 Tax=Nostoc sp. TaxID=1180 RepID=UPI002FFA1F33